MTELTAVDTHTTTHPATDLLLPTPRELRAAMPLSERHRAVVHESREQVRAILRGDDDRLLVLAGPCSIHDAVATREYADRLARVAADASDELLIVMRAYVEKPRTRLGWTGYLTDPELSGRPDFHAGAAASRRLMLDLLEVGIPLATEILDLTLHPYLEDLVSWSCIGARTVQSQPHRQAVSGLDVPVGFKNTTTGSVDDAIDALVTAARAHTVTGIRDDGRLTQRRTAGNQDCHVVLRGGSDGPNYDAISVARARHLCAAAGIGTPIVIDASHGNSGKNHVRQAEVVDDISERIAAGENGIGGVMLESFLEPGRQDLPTGTPSPDSLVYGLSVTDACMGWDATVDAIESLREAAARRSALSRPGQLRVAAAA